MGNKAWRQGKAFSVCVCARARVRYASPAVRQGIGPSISWTPPLSEPPCVCLWGVCRTAGILHPPAHCVTSSVLSCEEPVPTWADRMKGFTCKRKGMKIE